MPNTQVLRPQILTQVGHEGNPVECFIEVVGTLDSPNPFKCDDESCVDPGGPVLYPVVGAGGGGGGGSDAPSLPLNGSGGTMNCVSGNTTVPLSVTGGTGPFSWSTTAGDLGASLTTTGNNTLSPSENPHPETPGSAEGACVHFCGVFGFPQCYGWARDCAGVLIGCGGASVATQCTLAGITCPCADCGSCAGLEFRGPSVAPIACCDLPPCDADGDCEGCVGSYGTQVDMRDAGMIADGCNPCIVQFLSPPVITVTDANGEMVSFAVSVEYTP